MPPPTIMVNSGLSKEFMLKETYGDGYLLYIGDGCGNVGQLGAMVSVIWYDSDSDDDQITTVNFPGAYSYPSLKSYK